MKDDSQKGNPSQQGWADVALKRLVPKYGQFKACLFMESVEGEVYTYLALKEIIKNLNYHKTIDQFDKLREKLNETSTTFSGIDSGTRELYSTWYSGITKLSPERKRTPSQVLDGLSKLENEIASWGRALNIMNSRLIGQPPFKGKGSLSSRPQYFLAYKIRALYKDTFALSDLPSRDDKDFEVILEHILIELGCDSNISRVFKESSRLAAAYKNID